LEKSVISVTINREVLRWVRAKVEEGVFASRSHAVEYAVRQLMRQEGRPNLGEAA
jgi:Arc/MetJ-type ribon-helix-helix transcriptional regulator